MQGDRVVERLVVVARVALDRVRESVHARRGRDGRRQPQSQHRVDHGDMCGDQWRASDVELDAPLRIGDHRPQGDLAPGAGGRGDRDQRRYALLDRRTPPFVLRDRPAMPRHHAYGFGGIHRRAPADRHQPVAPLLDVDARSTVDELDIGIGSDVCEEDGTRQCIEHGRRDSGGNDPLIGDDQRASHAKFVGEAGHSSYGFRTVYQPGGDVHGPDRVNLCTHCCDLPAAS